MALFFQPCQSANYAVCSFVVIFLSFFLHDNEQNTFILETGIYLPEKEAP